VPVRPLLLRRERARSAQSVLFPKARCPTGVYITDKIVSCIPGGLNMPENITVVPYDAEWPQLFRRLGRELRAALQDLGNRIDHIGSTSISGMPAKPILDIQISVACLEPMGSYKTSLESLGFDWRDNNPDLTSGISERFQAHSASIFMCADRAVGVKSFRYSSATTCGHIQRVRRPTAN
jgi:GrpB protein